MDKGATSLPLICTYKPIFCSCRLGVGCYFVVTFLINIMDTVKSQSVLDGKKITYPFRFSVVKLKKLDLKLKTICKNIVTLSFSN